MRNVRYCIVAVPHPEEWFFLTVRRRFPCFCVLRLLESCVTLYALQCLAAPGHPWSVCVCVSVWISVQLQYCVPVDVIFRFLCLEYKHNKVFFSNIVRECFLICLCSVLFCSRRWSCHVLGRDQLSTLRARGWTLAEYRFWQTALKPCTCQTSHLFRPILVLAWYKHTATRHAHTRNKWTYIKHLNI